jgi:putative membrane protein
MADPNPAVDEPQGLISGDPSVELSSNRTSLSLERTRLSADRTLMSVIRTALSLISFGFTIFQFFSKAAAQTGFVTSTSAKRFGLALVLLGVGMLVAGLFSHTRMIGLLRGRRDHLHDERLLTDGAHYQTSPTAVIAVLLLLVGLAAVLGMVIRAGPLG